MLHGPDYMYSTATYLIDNRIGMDRSESDRFKLILLYYDSYFIAFSNILEPGETPSNSASHQAPD